MVTVEMPYPQAADVGKIFAIQISEIEDLTEEIRTGLLQMVRMRTAGDSSVVNSSRRMEELPKKVDGAAPGRPCSSAERDLREEIDLTD